MVYLAGLPLPFTYLVMLAVVSIHLESCQLLVWIPLYIAIVAAASYLIFDIKEYRKLGA